MPRTAIPGFIKKRTATQQYRRSPRQITRDITIALEMRDESVLSHVQILTEDGSTIEGNDITPELIKQLRSEGRNPMWYLRKNWLEQSYGRRGTDAPNGDAIIDNNQRESEDESITRTASEEGIVALMQESIRELKKYKEMLTDQLKIKDQQILETTERWKESNYISQGLNKRLESMEKRFELNSQLLKEITDRPAATTESETKIKPTPAKKVVTPISNTLPQTKKRSSKPKRGVVRKTAPLSSPTKKPQPPKWYDMPTFKKFLSRSK